MKVLEVDPNLDLYILFYPSFMYPLLYISSDKVIKRWGICRGLTIHKNGSKLMLMHEDKMCLEYAEEILGLWSIPRSTTMVTRRYRDFIETLIDGYKWFGIATSSLDDVELFSSIFLSQNTDFHKNVVRWVQTALRLYGSISGILNLDHKDVVKSIGGSYQVLRLVQALKEYIKYRDEIRQSSIDTVKNYLLRIKGVGPKVFNAYVMYVKKSTLYAPIDKNLIAFLSRFNIVSEIVVDLPRKSICIKYTCNTCPANSNCTYYRFREAFKDLSGWIQAVAYVHNKLMCRYRRCENCFLKSICKTYRDEYK